MATIGSVTKRDDGRYEGELRTLTIRADIAILPVGEKMADNQPDYRVVSQGIEIGAGWIRLLGEHGETGCRIFRFHSYGIVESNDIGVTVSALSASDARQAVR